jgi:heterodisulfide reductase subunit A-like polyferredoxin
MKPCYIGPCVSRDHFMIAWVSIQDYQGHSLKLSTQGNENCTRRVFDSCGCRPCARLCCPLSEDSFHLGLYMKNSFLFSVSSQKKNHFYLEDQGLLEVTRTLDSIEAGLYEAGVMERD